jgi:NAD(P)-dependent dehydrogenase (short-subunit alcohol dehydrogenase family)
MSPLFSLKDKVIVITGGLGQLGLAYARCLAGQGARVALLDIATTPGLPGSLTLQRHFAAAVTTALRSKRR